MSPRAGILAVFLAALASPAAAVDITISGNEGTDAWNAVNAAAIRWETNLTDSNVRVRISLVVEPITGTALARTSTYQTSLSYSSLRSRLTGDANLSSDDQAAIAHLPTGSAFRLLVNRTANNPNGSGSLTPYLDAPTGNATQDANNSTIALSRANAKALGVTLFGNTDAIITVNSNISWDYNPGDGITPGTYDLVGVATHEIAHALGFSSGVDVLDDDTLRNDYELTDVTPLDLFRYSANSVAQSALDWTTDGRDKYFSLDGGTTKIASFSRGVKYAGDYQASHWRLGGGLMAPAIGSGQIAQITGLDRQAMDVIGYQLNNTFKWVGSNSAWQDARNWNTDCIPYATTTALFDTAGTFTVPITSDASATSVSIRQGTVNLQLAGGNLNIGGDLMIGGSAGLSSIALNLTGSRTLRAKSIFVGGTAIAAGSASSCSIGPDVSIDVDPAGVLRIWNGSSLASMGNISAAVVVNRGTFSHGGGDLRIATSFTNESGVSTIGGRQNWADGAALRVNGGSVILNSDAGADFATLAISLSPSTVVTFNSDQHLKALALTSANAAMGTPNMLVLNTLTMDDNSVLDIGTGKMVVTNSADPSGMLAELQRLIGAARGADAKWTGKGITSTAAASDPNKLMGVGIILNNQNGNAIYTDFHGQSVGADSILISYTLKGDMDLNGVVNTLDYSRIDQGFLSQGSADPLKGYQYGDLDFSGVINTLDYALIDQAFLGQAAALASHPLSAAPVRLSAVVAPEPALSPGLVLGAIVLVRRRTRRAR